MRLLAAGTSETEDTVELKHSFMHSVAWLRRVETQSKALGEEYK